MADSTTTKTSLSQAWSYLMMILGFWVHTRAKQALNNQRVLANYMAGRPLWK